MTQTDCPSCGYPGGLDNEFSCVWEDGDLLFTLSATCFACEEEFRMRARWDLQDLKYGGIGWD